MIIKVDSSALRSSHCGRKLYLVLDGFRTKFLDASMEYGSALHIFLEDLALGNSAQEAEKKAMTYYLTQSSSDLFKFKSKKYEYLSILHLNSSIKRLQKEWDLGPKNFFGGPMRILTSPKGEPLVEKTFAIPYHKQGDVEILLCGTMDLILACGYTSDQYSIVINDYKTTAQNRQYYFDSYPWDPQLKFYQLAIKLQAELQPDSIWADMWNNHKIGGRITGLFHSADKGIEVAHSDIIWPDKDSIEDFEGHLRRACINLADHFNAAQLYPGYLPPREGVFNNTCKGAYGFMCEFANACRQDDETAYAIINNGVLVKKKYEPLTFRK